MVHIKALSKGIPVSSKKFDKNKSFSGVESKNKSPKRRRKSIAAVLPTPVKHKAKKNVYTEWTVTNENLNDEETPTKNKDKLFKHQEKLTELSSPLSSNVKKNKKSLVSDSITDTTSVGSLQFIPKNIKKKKISVSKEIDSINTSASVSPTFKTSKSKRKSKSNAEHQKSIYEDLIQNATNLLNIPNILEENKIPQAKESSKYYKKGVKANDIENAIEGVIKFRSENPKLKNILFTDSYPLFLQINCVKMPTGHSKILRIPLQHSVLTPDDEVCLIVPDVKGIRNMEHEKHVEHYEELLRNKGVVNVKKIMTFHELRTEYETFEQKSRLVELYDIFLVDGKISGKVVQKCGKVFYKRRKVPIPVKLQATKLKENLEKAMSKVFLFLHLKGDTYSVQFGHDQMETKKLLENVYSVIEFLDKEFPGGFDNIKGIQVCAQRSTSIPVYLNFKSPNEVAVPEVKPRLPKAYKTYKGELSTFDDAEVTVKPTGEVLVERPQNKKKGDDIITDSDLIRANEEGKKDGNNGKKKRKSRKRKQSTVDAETGIFNKKPKVLVNEGGSPEEKVGNKKKSKSLVKNSDSKSKVKNAKVKDQQNGLHTKVNESRIKKISKEKKNKDVTKIKKINKKKKGKLSES